MELEQKEHKGDWNTATLVLSFPWTAGAAGVAPRCNKGPRGPGPSVLCN